MQANRAPLVSQRTPQTKLSAPPPRSALRVVENPAPRTGTIELPKRWNRHSSACYVSTMPSPSIFRSDERYTQTEFRAWLDDQPDHRRYELLGGHIVREPPAGWPHAVIEVEVTKLLREQCGRGIVMGSSAGYDLESGDTVEPDASFIAVNKLARGPQPVEGQFLRTAPSIVVEILSPSTARRDRIEKRRIYERNGVEEYWIVDPRKRSVQVYSLQGDCYGRPKTYTQHLRSRFRPELRVEVQDLFAGLDRQQ